MIEDERAAHMDALVTKTLDTPYGQKVIAVHAQDILDLDEPLDVMTISAFRRDYAPVPGTLLGALEGRGVSAERLARDPQIDLREACDVWLSREIGRCGLPIGRLGCIELTSLRDGDAGAGQAREQQILSRIQAYFHLLHIASLAGIEVGRIGLPILGGGNQGIDAGLTTVPTLNECLRLLNANERVREIHVISRNQAQAYQFASALDRSYAARRAERAEPAGRDGAREGSLAFISYSSGDRNVADNLCARLEARGLPAWYAPRDIRCSDYASAIADAIARCTHFVVVLSERSLRSNHVLNEIDLAFQEIGRGMRFLPLRIDEGEMGPAFRYYLSRQHWMDARVPPLEQRLDEFAERVVNS